MSPEAIIWIDRNYHIELKEKVSRGLCHGDLLYQWLQSIEDVVWYLIAFQETPGKIGGEVIMTSHTSS